MNCGTLRTFKQRRISRLAKSDIRPFGHVSEKFRPEYAERSGFRGGRCIAPAGRAEGTSNPSTAMTISQQTFCSKIDPEDTPGTEADRALPVPAGPKAHQIHQMLQIMAISGQFYQLFSLWGGCSSSPFCVSYELGLETYVRLRYFEGLSSPKPARRRSSNLKGSEVLAKSVQNSLRARGSQTAAEQFPRYFESLSIP